MAAVTALRWSQQKHLKRWTPDVFGRRVRRERVDPWRGFNPDPVGLHHKHAFNANVRAESGDGNMASV